MGKQTSSTKPQKHSDRAHALLSASTAERWMNCTPSAKLEAEFGEKQTSSYAEEGTLAHELAELYLRQDVLHNISDAEFNLHFDGIMADNRFDDEMLERVPIYTDYCVAQFNEAQAKNDQAIIQIESKIDLSDYIPNSFGTADCVIISDGRMEVIDLKYGKGLRVSATYNKQLMLYGLGSLLKYDLFYDIEEVVLTIVQPRLDNISSWSISVADLRSWAENEVKPKARMAYEGRGDLAPGAWCRFCGFKHRCRKLYDEQMELAKYEFKTPDALTDDEIADIVKRAGAFTEWSNSIAEYALKLAVNSDKQWPGLKVVEGRSNRRWVNEVTVEAALPKRLAGFSEKDLFTRKIKTITAIEKLIGKKRFQEELSDLVIKPQGKPVLVPEEDKRPALGYEQAKEEFSE